MGADARWVCHTCKTICSRGGTPIFKQTPSFTTVEEVKRLKEKFCSLMEFVELVTDNEERYISFLDDLMIWLKRHEGHQTHIGSDYSTDMMDDEDYREETLHGKVSATTRHEGRMEMAEDVESRAAGAVPYKKFYNKDRGLPEPIWGNKAEGLQCPTCGSQNIYYSGSPDDPEEIFGSAGDVRCGHCGHITDWYEAHKQRKNHPTERVREVIIRYGKLVQETTGS